MKKGRLPDTSGLIINKGFISGIMSKFATLVCLIAFLSSCIQFKEMNVTQINGFQVTKMSPGGIEGEIKVIINNPNSMAFKVYRSKAEIMYGDVYLGTAHLVKKVKIPANSSIEHTFILKGDLKNITFAALPALLSSKNRQMQIKGHIKAGKWFYKKKFPLDQKQKLKGLDFSGGIPGF